MVSDNRLEDRVRCIMYALCGSDEPRTMRPTHLPSQMQGVMPRGSTAADGVVVPAKTLTQVVLEEGSDAVDLLKMDIEGSEYEVILNTAPAVLRRVRRIALEYHAAEADAPSARRRLFAHLAEAGFSLRADTRDPNGYGVAEFTQRVG